jgi:branched-chain amino acid transport system substrate-binding protein
MINRSLLVLAAVLLSTGLGLSAVSAQETVNLGLVLPESGSSGDYVKRHMMEPTIFAANEINEKGGLLGKKVQVINEDATDPTSAVSALRKLVDVNHVLAVFSAYTPLVLPQIPVAEDAHVILLSSAEHPDFTKSKWTVRMTPTADKAGARIAQIASDNSYKTAVTLSEDNESVRLTDRTFHTEFEKRGGKVLVSETFKRDDTDLRGQLTKMKAAGADIVYLMASSPRPLALALRQMHEVGLTSKQIYSMNSIEDPDVRALGPEMTNGIIYSTLRVDPAFAERFKKATGYDADANVGKHYDATWMLFSAARRANSLDPVKVRDAMYNYGEYDGVLGKFIFQVSGEPVIYPVVVMVKDGGAVPYKE